MHAAGSTTFQYSRLRGLEQIGLDATDNLSPTAMPRGFLLILLGSDITQGKIHLAGESGGYTQLQHWVSYIMDGHRWGFHI